MRRLNPSRGHILAAAITITRECSVQSLSLMRLFQLVSPALPIGAYAYSQGLEQAVEIGWVHDEESCEEWIEGCCRYGLARLDAPVLVRLLEAWRANDIESVVYWSMCLHASRETDELQREDQQLGTALARLLGDMGIEEARLWTSRPYVTWATLFSLAATRWHIGVDEAVGGYLWSWCESQVAAGIKLVPLGQTAGQRIVWSLGEMIPELSESAQSIEDDEIGAFLPGLAKASSLHETQYCRLFRS